MLCQATIKRSVLAYIKLPCAKSPPPSHIALLTDRKSAVQSILSPDTAQQGRHPVDPCSLRDVRTQAGGSSNQARQQPGAARPEHVLRRGQLPGQAALQSDMGTDTLSDTWWPYVFRGLEQTVCLLVDCLTSQQHPILSQGRILYVLPHWDRSCRSNFPSH